MALLDFRIDEFVIVFRNPLTVIKTELGHDTLDHGMSLWKIASPEYGDTDIEETTKFVHIINAHLGGRDVEHPAVLPYSSTHAKSADKPSLGRLWVVNRVPKIRGRPGCGYVSAAVEDEFSRPTRLAKQEPTLSDVEERVLLVDRFGRARRNRAQSALHACCVIESEAELEIQRHDRARLLILSARLNLTRAMPCA